MTDLSKATTIVVGASRGLGHGIATAFAEAGAPVIAVSRTPATFPAGIQSELADAADPTVPATLIDRHDPSIIVLVAGATPHMRPLRQQTWETFSLNWHTDVRLTFHWLRESLLTPLRPGSHVIVFSSGAALNPGGSPLSGGYAGAKATQRLLTTYAQSEAEAAGLDLTFTTVLPRFAPQTGVGRPAVHAYAASIGQTPEQYLENLDYQPLTPQIAGTTLVKLTQTDPTTRIPAYLLTGAGLQDLP